MKLEGSLVGRVRPVLAGFRLDDDVGVGQEASRVGTGRVDRDRGDTILEVLEAELRLQGRGRCMFMICILEC